MKRVWTAVLLVAGLVACSPATQLYATPLAPEQELKKPVVVTAFVLGEFSGALGGRFKDLLATELENHKFKLLWDPSKAAGDLLLVANVQSLQASTPKDLNAIAEVSLRVIDRSSGETLWRYTYKRTLFYGSSDQDTAKDMAAALMKSFFPRDQLVQPHG